MEPIRREQETHRRLGVNDRTSTNQIDRLAEGNMNHAHLLLLGPLPGVGDGLATGGQEQVGRGIGHTGRRDDDGERINGSRTQTDLLGELPTRGLLRCLTHHIAHPRWHLQHFPLEGRPILLDKHHRGDTLRIEQQWNHSYGSRGAHDVSLEGLAGRRLKLSHRHRPDVPLMNRALADAPELGHRSDARVRAV